jgi:hypothetical protein
VTLGVSNRCILHDAVAPRGDEIGELRAYFCPISLRVSMFLWRGYHSPKLLDQPRRSTIGEHLNIASNLIQIVRSIGVRQQRDGAVSSNMM